MRVIEKFTRTGNQLLYEVTVDDPEVLVEPWVMPARARRLSNNPVIVAERGSCRERVERGLHANAALVLFLSIEDPCAGGPARPTTVVARNVSHNPLPSTRIQHCARPNYGWRCLMYERS